MVICLSGELNQELLETVLSKLYNVKSPLAHPKQGWQEGDDELAEVEQAICMLNTSNHWAMPGECEHYYTQLPSDLSNTLTLVQDKVAKCIQHWTHKKDQMDVFKWF